MHVIYRTLKGVKGISVPILLYVRRKSFMEFSYTFSAPLYYMHNALRESSCNQHFERRSLWLLYLRSPTGKRRGTGGPPFISRLKVKWNINNQYGGYIRACLSHTCMHNDSVSGQFYFLVRLGLIKQCKLLIYLCPWNQKDKLLNFV